MNLETMKCPNCGAPLYFPNPNQDFCFCSSCGTQVYKQNNNQQLELEKMILKEQSRNNRRGFIGKLLKGYLIYCIISIFLAMLVLIFFKIMGIM